MKALIRKIAGFQDVEIFTQFSWNLILAWAFSESHSEVQDDVFNRLSNCTVCEARCNAKLARIAINSELIPELAADWIEFTRAHQTALLDRYLFISVFGIALSIVQFGDIEITFH